MLSIRHETMYRYAAPLVYSIQQLRLFPRAEPHQRVLEWNIAAPATPWFFSDAFGNRCHMLTLTGPHREIGIVAHGTVEIIAPDRGRIMDGSILSPLIFTAATRLTEADESILEFAARHLPSGARSGALLDLAEAIRDTVVYRAGVTNAASTAAEALRLRQGVCQDHAHLFLSCCRTRGIPARYVSGYIDSGATGHGATHAWVDAWVEEIGFTGWVSIDVTHGRLQNHAYCRLAVGRDYDSAAPVRGMRRGGGQESMAVDVVSQ